MKSLHVILAVILSASVLFTGCDRSDSPELGRIQAGLDSLRLEVHTLSLRTNYLESKGDPYNTAELDPAANGFSRLDTSIGSFAISLEDVQSYADGLRLHLRIGNLTSATVNGAIVKAKWGPRFSKTEDGSWLSSYVEWKSTLREITSDVHEDLLPGIWNKVTIVLPATSEEQFGHLEVTMQTTGVTMAKPE